MVNIQRVSGAAVEQAEENDLIKHEGIVRDDDDFCIEAVEYCLVGCDGPAHVTNVADSAAHFCDRHVHRSVHVTAKRFPSCVGSAASLG